MNILNKKDIIKKTEDFVKDYMKNYDDSHSFEHVLRVKHMATKIGLSENLDENQIFIIQLGALTHDINDSKYKIGDETQQNILRTFFDNLIDDKEVLEKIISISCNVSLSVELSNNYNSCNDSIELDCVRDADRIDSLGSMGISRYFTYGIVKKNSKIIDIIKNIENRTNKIMNGIKTTMGKNISYEKYEIIKIFIEDYYSTIL
jgi:uncharacterized protein